MLTALIASLAAAGSLILGAYWFVRKPQMAETRLRTLAREALTGPRTKAQARRAGQVSARRLSVMPRGWMKSVEGRLDAAGKPLTPQAFWGVVVTSAILVPFMAYILFVMILGANLTAIIMFFLFLATLLGMYAPFFWLRSKVRSRHSQLRKELPDVLDLVTLCVESGLGLDGAFRRVSQEMTGAFCAEIEQMLQEVDLGKPRRDALEDMAARTAIPEIGTVTASMIQSQQMGTSLSQTLRSQTQLLRLRRRQRAEQTARQASVKMAFPLVLFLMPSLFLIVLGPIAIGLFRALSG